MVGPGGTRKGPFMKKSPWILILAWCGLLGIGGCSSMPDVLAGRPTASLEGVKFGTITFEGATVIFDLKVNNPYEVILPLVNVDYNLASNAQRIMSGQADIQDTIPARGSKVLSLPAHISYLEVARAFKSLAPGAAFPYQADLGLSMDTPVLGRLRLPIKKSGELTVPTVPYLSKIDWNKYDRVVAKP
jgi:LEA14-like dessication related protein